MADTETQPQDELQFRPPRMQDALAVTELLRSCRGLDRNSHYAQLLLCWHFADTCVLATDAQGHAVGFVSAYRPPARPVVVFVWQIAVSDAVRGRGVAKRLLDALMARDAVREVRYLEATVTPSNAASRGLFTSWAKHRNVDCVVSEGLGEELFGTSEPHEREDLFRIGPF